VFNGPVELWQYLLSYDLALNLEASGCFQPADGQSAVSFNSVGVATVTVASISNIGRLLFQGSKSASDQSRHGCTPLADDRRRGRIDVCWIGAAYDLSAVLSTNPKPVAKLPVHVLALLKSLFDRSCLRRAERGHQLQAVEFSSFGFSLVFNAAQM